MHPAVRRTKDRLRGERLAAHQAPGRCAAPWLLYLRPRAARKTGMRGERSNSRRLGSASGTKRHGGPRDYLSPAACRTKDRHARGV